MTDTRRSEATAGQPPLDERDGRVESRIEQLLVEGLDHYFAGRYENAIHVWTRVLFLDRSHPRARAYIDRARTAVSERQRRSDELLNQSQDLLARGEANAARSILSEAVAHGDDERAAAIRARLERLERATVRLPGGAQAPADVFVPPTTLPATMRRNFTPVMLVAGLAVAIVVTTLVLAGSVLPRWIDFGTTAGAPALAAARPAPLPVPSTSEVALIRARTLYEHGRLADALQALDRVALDSPFTPQANRLRIDIERLLLAASASTPSRSGGQGPR